MLRRPLQFQLPCAIPFPIVPVGLATRGARSPPCRMSVSYASSEIIVEIIDITEKCSLGFVLITQVTAHITGLMALRGPCLTCRAYGQLNNSMLRFAIGM